MSTCKIISRGTLFAAILVLSYTAVHAELTTSGLLLNYEAGDNSLATAEPKQWENLGPLGGFIPQGGSASPLFGTDEDLVAWYSFDGTIRGVGEASFGKRGNTNSEAVNVEDFTVELWARRLGDKPPDPHSEHHLFQFRDFGAQQIFTVTLAPDATMSKFDTLRFDFIDEFGPRDNGSTGHVMQKESIFGDFHQYVFTFDNNDTGDFKLWVDGGASPEFTFNSIVQFSSGNAMEVFIGGIHQEVGRRFQGDISVFRVYDRLLSQGEIAANFAHGPSLGDTPTPLPIVSSSVVQVPGALEAAFDTEEGKEYGLQVTSDLVNGSWDDTGQSQTGDGGSKRLYYSLDAEDMTAARVVLK